MNIFSRLNQLVALTESELILVNFINQYPLEFSKMKLTEICSDCFISKSTIYRLCHKLNISGLVQLKILVSQDYQQAEKIDFNYDFPVLPDEINTVIPKNLEDLYKHTIQNTKNLVNTSEYEAIAQLLFCAKNITLYTSAGNVFFAENFQFQMQEIGKKVSIPKEEYQIRLDATQSTDADVAIVISYGGRSKILHDVLKLLVTNQTPIIFITSTLEKHMKLHADHVLYLNSTENHYNKISSFSTRLSLLYVLDLLYMYYFKLNYQQNFLHKKNTYEKMRGILDE